ncbi:MAG: NAD(P)H-dependent oxidoreductase, partial [Duncaniella sp.]|nr:NAD(P)H-dependent oxidoreductase [Duncaniella sp.]
MTTILYAHPYDKSFNHAILETVKAKLTSENREFSVLDLYADGFNPVLDAASLRLYSRGETADP